MNPELAKRLRQFGDTVDRAAIAEAVVAADGADRDCGALAEVETLGTPVVAGRSRWRSRALASAAALLAVVVGGFVLADLGSSPAREFSPTGSGADGVVTGTFGSSPDSGPVSPTTAAPPVVGGAATNAPTTAITATSTSTSSTSSSSSSSSSTTTSPTTSGAPSTPRPPVCPRYTPNNQYPLQLCNSGTAVMVIQNRLAATIGAQVNIDGDFGPGTETAVRQFQRANGLAVDGLVGPDTWAALIGNGVAGTDANGNNVIDPYEINV